MKKRENCFTETADNFCDFGSKECRKNSHDTQKHQNTF